MQILTVWQAAAQRARALLTHQGAALLGLALRWYVGMQFFRSGLTKLDDWSATLALFRDEYHVPLLPPDLAAVFGAGAELGLPLLLFGGLLSRPAAAALFCVNVVAVLSYRQLFGFECPAALNDHFYWGVVLLVLVVHGPGAWSLDRLWLPRDRSGRAA